MTDERIKEEFERWTPSYPTTQEFDFIAAIDNHAWQCVAVGFYAGFRTAERLAKIEVLESVLDLVNCGSTESILQDVEEMLSELKDANR